MKHRFWDNFDIRRQRMKLIKVYNHEITEINNVTWQKYWLNTWKEFTDFKIHKINRKHKLLIPVQYFRFLSTKSRLKMC